MPSDTEIYTINYTMLREHFFLLETAFANNLYFYKNHVQTIRVYLLKLMCVCVCIDDKKRKIRINKVK